MPSDWSLCIILLIALLVIALMSTTSPDSEKYSREKMRSRGDEDTKVDFIPAHHGGIDDDEMVFGIGHGAGTIGFGRSPQSIAM